MRVKFEDIAGSEIGTPSDGGERKYVCLACDKPNLYRNHWSGLWQCFSCGTSGKFFPAHTNVCTPKLNHERKPVEPWLGEAIRTKQAHFHAGRRAHWARRGLTETTLSRAGMFEWDKGLAIPLTLAGEYSGIHVYNPLLEYRYHTNGYRGVHHLLSVKPPSVPLVVSEGLFDHLNLAQTLVNVLVNFMFLAGNKISPEQLAEILHCTSEDMPVFLAFDNDKPGAALKAANMLRPYRHVRIETPPGELCKDWDEACRVDRAWVSDYWLGVLKGSDESSA